MTGAIVLLPCEPPGAEKALSWAIVLLPCPEKALAWAIVLLPCEPPEAEKALHDGGDRSVALPATRDREGLGVGDRSVAMRATRDREGLA